MCSSTEVNIGFSPEVNVSYNWNPSDGLSSNAISNPNFNSSNLSGDEFIYTLTSTSSNGCSFEDTLTIKLHEKEKAGDDQRLCPGFGVTLRVDSGVASVNWQGENIDNPTSLTPFVSPLVSSLYCRAYRYEWMCFNRHCIC